HRLAQGEGGAGLLLAHEGSGQARRGREEEDDPEERRLQRRPILRGEAERADGVGDERERRRREEEDREDRDAAAQLLGHVLAVHGPGGADEAHAPALAARSSIRCSGAWKSRSSLEASTTGPRVRARATTAWTISRPSASSPDIGSSRTRTGGSK